MIFSTIKSWNLEQLKRTDRSKKKSKSPLSVMPKRVYSEEGLVTSLLPSEEHYKATHNCSAFIIGERGGIKRTSDDGDPVGLLAFPCGRTRKSQSY